MAILILATSCGRDDSGPTAPAVPPGSTYPLESYREAARITGIGARSAIANALPGQTEGYVKGIIATAFHTEGCDQAAFVSIVATGANAVVLHYPDSDSTLRPGNLVLIDIGATSGGICSDCSRTFPVGPAFDPRQRELYELVLNALRQVVGSARPGIDSLLTLDRRARAIFRASPLRARDANDVLQPMDVFFTHRIGHYVGKSVHGEDTWWSVIEPLEAGQVLAVEPGLYIPSEGIGIRIEDTYLVTDTGLECLTCGCPKEVVEVEALRPAFTSESAATARAGSPSPAGT